MLLGECIAEKSIRCGGVGGLGKYSRMGVSLIAHDDSTIQACIRGQDDKENREKVLRTTSKVLREIKITFDSFQRAQVRSSSMTKKLY